MPRIDHETADRELRTTYVARQAFRVLPIDRDTPMGLKIGLAEVAMPKRKKEERGRFTTQRRAEAGFVEYPRFNWLLPGKLAGAPHPDLCEGLPAVAPFLRGQGIGGIVTLFDRPLEPDPEELGFHYLFTRTPDFRPPADFSTILSFIETNLVQGRGVLVHCFAGIGRTGTVLAAWLLSQDPGLSAAQAVSRVREQYIPDYARLRFPEHPSQAAALEQFAAARGNGD